MAGISDIPCVGKAVDRISDAIIDAGIRGVRYVFCYNSIRNDLTSQIEKVKVREKEVSRKADADRADGKTIKDHVIKWQKGVEEIKTRAEELFKQRPSWNPVTRFRLGRKAAQEAKNVADLTASGVELLTHEIAFLPRDANIPICDSTYQTFGSREEAYGKLWEALVKVDGPPIIGIYGMPGVGKTRMMEQAWEDAKTKKIFDKVTRANVGAETIDVIKLQNQLAGYLGCHFESADNELSRASQLKNSLSNGGKILVVLDDVWDHIPLQKIGIPLAEGIPKGCKILLTSRKGDVCLRNDCKDPIKINHLTDDEAWDMFKSTVGTSKIDSFHDTSLAENVCKECGGLPLLIHAVGNALKFDNENSWKNALSKLQNHHFDEIEGMESGVSAAIQLSFDRLGKDTKSCLFLCSVFPEDSEIEIKMLEDFANGSQLLNPGINVRGVVDKLISSSLLLQGKTFRTVKLHDIIRDVARCLAAKDKEYAFIFVRAGSRLPINVDYSTWRLLQFVESDNFRIPNDMVCPYLHTLWLERNNKPQQFPKSFFEGIGNLKILVLKDMDIIPEHMSVRTFNNLNVLILDRCDLNEIWPSIVPENLETLRISECRIPNPLDLSKLKSLRKLQVLCKDEIKMVQYSLSRTLEELHIPGGFKICDVEGKSISTPISSELNKLSALKSLNIRLEDSESCPNENIVGNLLDFIVHMGRGVTHFDRSNLYMRSVVFVNTSIEGGGKVLVERAEYVYIRNCDDIEHLEARMAQYEIQQSQPLTSFSNLTDLFIIRCRGLKYLFSASVAECLVQLEKLHIFDCPIVEVVIRNDERAIDGLIINFPKLKYLTLSTLPSLRSFYGESRADNTSIPDSLFDTTVVFSALETLFIMDLKISEIWEKNCDSFYQLKSLQIYGCPNLKFAIPHTMLPTLQKLQQLTIMKCESMTSEVESSSNECSNGESTFLALQSIQFKYMPALTHICRNSYPNLQELTIEECKRLRNVFLPSIVGHLKHLQKLFINDCEIMSEIIGEEEKDEDINCAFDFPQLTLLQLSSLPNFKNFCFRCSAEASGRYSYSNPKVSFPKLVTLHVDVKSIKLDEIELGGRDESTTNIKKLVVHCDNKLQLPSTWQLQFPNIEELSLKNCWWSWNIMEAFSSLKKLSIHSCYDMEHLAFLPQSQPLALFSTLTSLVIVSCSELKYLFSASVANCLVQLEQLRVQNCPTLEVVIRNESNGVIPKFPKLKELILANLESLRRFYGENRDGSSSSTTITETAAESESLFHGMVVFSALETLFIMDLKISEIWEKNCDSFYQLKSLEISFCPNLKFAIPHTMLPTLQKLQQLMIRGCESMTSEVESSSNECSNGESTFVALRSIQFCRMPTLTHIRLNSSRRNSYPNLQNLSIEECKRLRNVFLPSIVGHLKHLQKLFINDCEIMSEIIGEEEKDEDINCAFDFPQLTLLQLSSLPNFKNFCFRCSAEASGRYSYSNPKVSFPKLVTLHVDVKSIKLDEIELGGRDESTTNIKKLVVHCDNKLQLPSTWQLQFPNIEELSLKNCWWSWNIMEAFSSLKKLSIHSCYDMEHLAFLPQSQPLALFSTLTSLVIVSCSELKYLFSASVANCLVQLEQLRVQNCPTLEVVIRNESNGVIPKFPKLKELILANLESLRRFYGENRDGSSSSTTITETAAESESLFHGMVVFSALETLFIMDLKISEIWEKNCDSFYQLKSLEISFCPNLKFAIPHTMLPTLQKLQQLEIRYCVSMTSEVESSSNECSNGESTFVALQSIQFKYMPALTHICRNSYPNLQELTIEECKRLRNVFLPSIVGHLKHLQILFINDCEIMSEIIGEEEKDEDINCAFDFPQLTLLQLSSLPNFKNFCFRCSAEASGRYSYSNPKVSFPKLVTLHVDVKSIKLDEIELGGRDESTTNIKKLVVHCDNKLQLPSTWQLQFPNIEELSLKNCWWSWNIMEAFSSLKKLSIHSCYDMEHLAFLPQSQPLALFSTLTSLVIVSCSELKYLFSASVANCLVQLEQLRVQNCPTLEVVIRNESNGVIPKFPKLKELILANLESLRRFYGENRDGSSSSTTITETAAESESLFHGMVIFPALEKLRIQSLKTSEIWGENCYKNNSFCQLKLLAIESCPNLKFAIRLPMLETLQQLEELKICKCDSTLEVVVRNENATAEMIIKFPKLKELRLEELPSLTRFYGGTKATSSSSTTIIGTAAESESLFDGMAEYPALETLITESLKISEIWGTNCSKENSFCRLWSLNIKRCDNLEFAIPLAMLPTFQNLKRLDIAECKSMTSVVESSSSSSNECLPQLVALRSIDLINMPGLTQTGLNSRGRNLYPNLQRIKVSDCKSLKSVYIYSNKAQVVEYLRDAKDEDGE